MKDAAEGSVVGHLSLREGIATPMRCFRLLEEERVALCILVSKVSQRLLHSQAECNLENPEQGWDFPVNSAGALKLGMGFLACQFLKALQEMSKKPEC